MFSAQAKYTVLLIAIWATIASVVASQDPRFEQYPKEQIYNLRAEPRYGYNDLKRAPSKSDPSWTGALGKRDGYATATDMFSGMIPTGKRAPSMGTDMIYGMMPIGKRATVAGMDMISGMNPIGKRSAFINMKPILYPQSWGASPRTAADRLGYDMKGPGHLSNWPIDED